MVDESGYCQVLGNFNRKRVRLIDCRSDPRSYSVCMCDDAVMLKLAKYCCLGEPRSLNYPNKLWSHSTNVWQNNLALHNHSSDHGAGEQDQKSNVHRLCTAHCFQPSQLGNVRAWDTQKPCVEHQNILMLGCSRLSCMVASSNVLFRFAWSKYPHFELLTGRQRLIWNLLSRSSEYGFSVWKNPGLNPLTLLKKMWFLHSLEGWWLCELFAGNRLFLKSSHMWCIEAWRR